MNLDYEWVDERGDVWRRAGYSNPSWGGARPVYRYIRMTDGARVRLPSSKFYSCEVSRANLADWLDVPTGTDESASGGGARSIHDDLATVNFAREVRA